MFISVVTLLDFVIQIYLIRLQLNNPLLNLSTSRRNFRPPTKKIMLKDYKILHTDPAMQTMSKKQGPMLKDLCRWQRRVF
jgi:hypothetical protein